MPASFDRFVIYIPKISELAKTKNKKSVFNRVPGLKSLDLDKMLCSESVEKWRS